MRVFVYLPFLACIAASLLARPAARRANPRIATWILTATGLALAIAASGALALLAFAEVARLPSVAAYGRWSATAVGSRVPVPWWIGVIALLCMVAISVDVVRHARRYGQALVPAIHIQHQSQTEIIIVDDDSVYAYACRPWPLRPGVVLISKGLTRTLDDDARAAVVAHERSHLAHHHALYQLASVMIGALNPLLRPIRREIDFSLERWADEDAAAKVGREATAVALGISAAHATRRPRAFQAGLPHAGTRVPERMRALLEHPASRGRAILALTLSNAVLAAAAVALAAHNTELLFEILRK